MVKKKPGAECLLPGRWRLLLLHRLLLRLLLLKKLSVSNPPCFSDLHVTSLNSFAYWTKVQPGDIATFIFSGRQRFQVEQIMNVLHTSCYLPFPGRHADVHS